MDPQRIEEFRRKLREGGPVRVVGGRIVLDDPTAKAPAVAPAGPTPGGLAAGPPAAAEPVGQLVKPHDWGDEPFYATPEGEQRAFTERALLARDYPQFRMDVDDDGTPYAHGWIGPSDHLRHGYQILVILPTGYGRGPLPSAYVLEPRLRPGAPHVFNDGGLCLDHSGAFTRNSTLLTFLAWVTVWLALYEEWVDTGKAW